MMETVNKKTEDYYDDCQILYSLSWSKHALHYGFWEKDTKKLSDAIDNTDRFVSELLDLKKNDLVLDAGCGVGGSSVFMAKNFGVKIIGITLSQKQIKNAREHVKKMGLEELVSYDVMDFCKTKFKDNTFTKIFGIESVCHADNKIDFLKEAWRILKPGGRIVIDDGFLIKKNLNKEEKNIYDKCVKGWGGANLSHKEDFYNYLKKIGFKSIKFYDRTNEVIPSSQRIALYGYMLFPITYILSKLRIVSKSIHEHAIACINQRKTFNNFTLYGVFVADK